MKKSGININIRLSNRVLYSLIALLILAIVGVGVYAVAGAVPDPGHSLAQLQPCSDGEILKMSGNAWSCVGESDPTITATNIKDGVSWSEISSIPAGFSDGTDNTGITSESDPLVPTEFKAGFYGWAQLGEDTYSNCRDEANNAEPPYTSGCAANEASNTAFYACPSNGNFQCYDRFTENQQTYSCDTSGSISVRYVTCRRIPLV